MASMKITVDELRFKKTIYSKAAKNLRDVITVVKKAKSSIGNDRMFNEARQSLGKLAELLDRRATVLEALAEALVYSTDTYKSAQTHSVSQISEYKAHKTDFYGNPVHVSGSAVSGAVAGGVAASVSSAPSGVSQTAASSGSAGTGTGASYTGTPSANTTTATQGTAAGISAGSNSESMQSSSENYSEQYTDNSSINITDNSVVNNITENVFVSGEDFASESITDTVSVAETSASAPVSGVSGTSDNSGVSGAAMFGAGIASAAAAGAAAFGVSKIIKKKKEDNSLDHQIEEAKKKLQAIEDELGSSTSVETEDEGEDQ